MARDGPLDSPMGHSSSCKQVDFLGKFYIGY